LQTIVGIGGTDSCERCGYGPAISDVNWPFDCIKCPAGDVLVVVYGDCSGMCVDPSLVPLLEALGVATIENSACTLPRACFADDDYANLPATGTNDFFLYYYDGVDDDDDCSVWERFYCDPTTQFITEDYCDDELCQSCGAQGAISFETSRILCGPNDPAPFNANCQGPRLTIYDCASGALVYDGTGGICASSDCSDSYSYSYSFADDDDDDGVVASGDYVSLYCDPAGVVLYGMDCDSTCSTCGIEFEAASVPGLEVIDQCSNVRDFKLGCDATTNELVITNCITGVTRPYPYCIYVPAESYSYSYSYDDDDGGYYEYYYGVSNAPTVTNAPTGNYYYNYNYYYGVSSAPTVTNAPTGDYYYYYGISPAPVGGTAGAPSLSPTVGGTPAGTPAGTVGQTPSPTVGGTPSATVGGTPAGTPAGTSPIQYASSFVVEGVSATVAQTEEAVFVAAIADLASVSPQRVAVTLGAARRRRLLVDSTMAEYTIDAPPADEQRLTTTMDQLAPADIVAALQRAASNDVFVAVSVTAINGVPVSTPRTTSGSPSSKKSSDDDDGAAVAIAIVVVILIAALGAAAAYCYAKRKPRRQPGEPFEVTGYECVEISRKPEPSHGFI